MIAVAVFLGSFLLFGIQPMLGRLLLPGFGGSVAVWSACLAAYQVLLLAGYLYAHALAGAERQKQWRRHGAALAAAAVWCVLAAWGWQGVGGKIGSSGMPGLEVLGWVAAFIGLPYVVLAAGSSLLQSWQSQQEGRGVYRLYAVSNLGSFAGLFFHPLALEPRVSLEAQWWGFAAAFCAYAALVAALGWKLAKNTPGNTNAEDGTAGAAATAGALPRALAHPAWWCALPGLSSFLLVAVTNHLTQDVTPIPLMWALLLGLFLLSYVAGFSRLGEKWLPAWALLAAAGTGIAACLTGLKGNSNLLFFQMLFWTGLAFLLICVFLHSWLHAARPHARGALTRFYLGVAAGGALGGVSGSLLCPLLFKKILEWPAGIVMASGCLLWFVWKGRLHGANTARAALLALCCIPAWLLYNVCTRKLLDGEVVFAARNFYGTITIVRQDITREGERREDYFTFLHGQTAHGAQNRRHWDEDAAEMGKPNTVSAPDAKWRGFPLVQAAQKTYAENPGPNMYFGPSGGGAAILSRRARDPGKPLRVAVVGLGAGTLAAWGRPGDLYRFYEIDPEVANVALDDRYFNFLTGSKAWVEIVLGDARKILEAERAAGFEKWDVLYMDAYNSDSIPLHLATREAFALYRDRLAEGGILVLQMTNWHINLMPLAKAVANETGMALRGLWGNPHGGYTSSLWAFLSENDFQLVCDPAHGFEIVWDEVKPMAFLPSDFRGNLVSLVKFFGMNEELPLQRRFRE